MKIRRISAYQVDLPLHEGSYRWSGGKSVTVFDSTIVRVETDAGLVGHGEVCPLGPFYLPAYADGVRAGIAELGPHLLGEDPTELARLNRRMDAALKGHPYVKSGIDMACWDILGQAAGLPVCTLLGGRYGDDFVLYRAISQESPEEMAGEGRRLSRGGLSPVSAQGRRRSRTSTSPGSAPWPRCSSPATGWSPTPTPAGCMHEAARVVRAVRDVDVYIEQPCLSYEECLSVRRRTDHPFVLDETIDGIDVLLRGHARPGDGRGEPQDQQVRRADRSSARRATCACRWASP